MASSPGPATSTPMPSSAISRYMGVLGKALDANTIRAVRPGRVQRPPEPADLGADPGLIDDVQRGAPLGGQVSQPAAADDELAVGVHPGAGREQPEQLRGGSPLPSSCGLDLQREFLLSASATASFTFTATRAGPRLCTA